MGVSAACGEGVALLDAWDVINAVHCVCQSLTDGGMPWQWMLLLETHVNIITQEAIHTAMFGNVIITSNIILPQYKCKKLQKHLHKDIKYQHERHRRSTSSGYSVMTNKPLSWSLQNCFLSISLCLSSFAVHIYFSSTAAAVIQMYVQ